MAVIDGDLMPRIEVVIDLMLILLVVGLVTGSGSGSQVRVCRERCAPTDRLPYSDRRPHRKCWHAASRSDISGSPGRIDSGAKRVPWFLFNNRIRTIRSCGRIQERTEHAEVSKLTGE